MKRLLILAVAIAAALLLAPAGAEAKPPLPTVKSKLKSSKRVRRAPHLHRVHSQLHPRNFAPRVYHRPGTAFRPPRPPFPKAARVPGHSSRSGGAKVVPPFPFFFPGFPFAHPEHCP